MKFVNASALAVLLGASLAFGAQAGQADKAADRQAGASAGASAQQGGVSSMAPKQLIGKKVVSGKGKQLGEIRDILRSEGGDSYALVDLPGDATPPAKQLMPLDELRMKGEQVTWLSERAESRAEGMAAGVSSQGKQNARAAMSRDEPRNALQDAGLQDIQVVDAAYLVHAQAADGSPIFMMIDPPRAGASAGSSQQPAQGQSGQTQAAAMGQDKLRNSLQQAGFQEIAVLDAAYLVRAETEDGSPVAIMIDAAASPAAATQAGASAKSKSK